MRLKSDVIRNINAANHKHCLVACWWLS